jgi:hypothetical protein
VVDVLLVEQVVGERFAALLELELVGRDERELRAAPAAHRAIAGVDRLAEVGFDGVADGAAVTASSV